MGLLDKLKSAKNKVESQQRTIVQDLGDDVYLEQSIKRDQWNNKFDFLVACIGFSVGLGNVWRFPYLCYKNGGGAFLLPYFFSVLVGGIPVFFLEVVLGQLMACGGIEAWNIVPLFKGIGVAGISIVFFLNCYYNVVLAWSLHFLFASFTSVLPWTHCNNTWNTDRCRVNATQENNTNDPANEYWEFRVLQISDGIDDVGGVRWDLALCLLLGWIIVFACICKGIGSSGKVMYVTATSPYVLMIILAIRTCTLDGALDGLRYYLRPDWSKLAELEVWSDAGTQIFFSYSISLGTLTALGSYNGFNHNSVRDCVIFAFVNSFTSLLAGMVVFATLGYMAFMQQVDISEVAESGPGLAFVVYPKALGTMPVSPLWSILFFVMVLLLGLDSQFVGVEGLMTAIVDLNPRFFAKRFVKPGFLVGLCLIMYLIGLSMVTNGGMYVFQVLDYYIMSRIVLIIAFFECMAISYVYGASRLLGNMRKMFGFSTTWVPAIMWMSLTPIFCLVLFGFSIHVSEELTYKRSTGGDLYTFPKWTVVFGWTVATIIVMAIPVVMALQLYRAEGPLVERLRTACQPRFSEGTKKNLMSVDLPVNSKDLALDHLVENQGKVNGISGKGMNPTTTH